MQEKSTADGRQQDACENRPALTPDQIFSEYADRIYHLARRLLGNESDAQDVTQDVFVQVMRKLPTFRGEAAFPTWLFRVAVNAALAYRRRRTVREEHCVHDPREDGSRGRLPHWVPEPEKRALDHEVHDLIDKAAAKLPERYRDVYVLADVEELPNTEIADMLQLSVAAVKSRLHRAREIMRHLLGPYFDEAGTAR